MKTLIIVSGGEAPGVNAAIAHYVDLALDNGDAVVGAKGGFAGLLDGDVIDLDRDSTAPYAGLAGTILPTSRDPVLKDAANHQRLADAIKRQGADNLLLFGGNGTLRHIPPILEKVGVPCAGLPTTIDNDVPYTERTLGFDSACNYAHQAIDQLLLSARGLRGRIFWVETLGGDSGFIALAVAYATGAHAVHIPEFDYDLSVTGARLLEMTARDGYGLLVTSEGIDWQERVLAGELAGHIGMKVRDVRLGHAQRGSKPTHVDRTLARDMTRAAYFALRDGLQTGTVVVQDNRVQVMDGIIGDQPPPMPNRQLYDIVNGFA